jgi:hypothetical protein
VEQVAREVDVLPPDRLVQSELLPELGDLLRGRVGAVQDHFGGITRHEMDQGERDHGDADDDRDRGTQAAQDEQRHQPSVALWNAR